MPPSVLFALLSIVLWPVILFLMGWLIVRTGRTLRPGEPELGPEEMSGHDLWGLFYCNPDDPRAWVPRFDAQNHNNGTTINMRHRSWAIAIGVVFVGGIVIICAGPFLHWPR